ncbi:dTDP-4-dehydrorhamnose 3,5-epimerase family protein [Marinomonas arenicola]|uniref:dTDP-4-dehydrorhamnose 3,5-epimerase family protein n=1 Tax=Marinomonas arenicola TaxID=569601 RepID=UPI00311D5EEC
MKYISTNFDGLFLIEPTVFSDGRGEFYRVYCDQKNSEFSDFSVKQINHSITKEKGTVRGFHFQYEPNAEAKIVKCIRGSVYDVVVDIRKGSPTFLSSYTVELSAKKRNMLLIPKGFAHAFQALENDSELLYLHSEFYTPANEGGLNHKDPLLDIIWPLGIKNISERDGLHKFLNIDFEGIEINEM